VATGRCYVVLGKTDTDLVQLADVAAGIGGFAIDGEADQDVAGASLDGVGDTNGDGLVDFVVQAPGVDSVGTNSGRTYVVFGQDTGDAIELADVAAGIGGFMIEGDGEYGNNALTALGAGDVDADGLTDIFLGTPWFGPDQETGRSYVVFGKADTAALALSDIVLGIGGFVLDAEAPGARAGAIGGGGDIDGDGVADVIVGARGSQGPGGYTGRAYVVFGVPTAPE
jgi:hypothetical protein